MEVVLGVLGIVWSWIVSIYKELLSDPWLIVILFVIYFYESAKARQQRSHFDLSFRIEQLALKLDEQNAAVLDHMNQLQDWIAGHLDEFRDALHPPLPDPDDPFS